MQSNSQRAPEGKFRSGFFFPGSPPRHPASLVGTGESLRWPCEYEARAFKPSFRSAGRRYYFLDGPERCLPKSLAGLSFSSSLVLSVHSGLFLRGFSPRQDGCGDSMTERRFQIIFGRRRFRIPLILFLLVIAFVLWISYTVGFLRGRVEGFPDRSRESTSISRS